MPVFAVDVGGTRIKLGLIHEGHVIARTSLESHSDEGFALALPRISKALKGLTDQSVSGIGIAFPSLISEGRVIGDVGKFTDAEDLDLAAWAEAEFEAPLVLENDARMAAIGEWQYGAARGASDVVMVTLGTGIGTGVILAGEVLRGRHGAAGILGGHMTAQVGGLACPCGNIGCWETLASNASLSRADLPDYSHIFLSDSQESLQIRKASLDVWGALAVSLIHAYDPEILVFGGGVLASGESILAPIRETVRSHAWTPWGPPKIVASELGDDAALLACEWLLKAKQ